MGGAEPGVPAAHDDHVERPVVVGHGRNLVVAGGRCARCWTWGPSGGQTRAMSEAPRRSLLQVHGRRSATVALSAAMVAWGTTGVAAKAVDLGGMALAAYRSSVGAVALDRHAAT